MKKITGLDCIILVDDDKITNFINQRVIKKADIDVIVKVNQTGLEAINYLQSMNTFSTNKYPRPGIIFLDINMPGMNGWDFINEFKKLPEEQREKIVIAMLTTSTNPDDENNAKALPEINIFLKKPLSIDKLNDTIKAFYATL